MEFIAQIRRCSLDGKLQALYHIPDCHIHAW